MCNLNNIISPTATRGAGDRVVWKEEKDWEYTVRTGYNMLMHEKEEGRPRAITGKWKNL
jgi:hypothetical protein